MAKYAILIKRLEKFSKYSNGGIAQLGERLHGMQEAVGSSPIISTLLRSTVNTRKYRRALNLLGFAVLFSSSDYVL